MQRSSMDIPADPLALPVPRPPPLVLSLRVSRSSPAARVGDGNERSEEDEE